MGREPTQRSCARELLPALRIGAPDARLVRALCRVRRHDRVRVGRRGIRVALLPGLVRPAPASLRALQRARPPGAGDLGAIRDHRDGQSNLDPGRVQRARADRHARPSALDIADASPPTGVVGTPYSYTFQLSPGRGAPARPGASPPAPFRRVCASRRTIAPRRSTGRRPSRDRSASTSRSATHRGRGSAAPRRSSRSM